jgi:copper(I)-binding protein
MSVTTRAARSLVAILAVAGLAACGSDSTAQSTGATGDGGIEITGAWARTSPASADNGAAYLDITAADGDRLVSASVDPAIASTVQIHEMVAMDTTSDSAGMTGDSMAMEDHTMTSDSMAMGDDTTSDSMAAEQPMTMRELADGLELPAGKTVSLAPGGYHVMLIGLGQPLKAGSTFDLHLSFEKAPEQTVSVQVRDDAP